MRARLLAVLPGPIAADTTGRRRPDPVLPLIAGAFFLGIVLASVAALGLRIAGGEQVPARTYHAAAEQAAAAQAVTDAQRDALAAQDAALTRGEALARRLVAALAAPRVTAAQLAALRGAVDRQSRLVERTRVVRVPGPTVTVPPAPTGRSSPAPQPAQSPPATAAPSPTPPPCAVKLLGICLTSSS